MDLKHIIDQKDHYADYMVDEITHICRDFEKREPGALRVSNRPVNTWPRC